MKKVLLLFMLILCFVSCQLEKTPDQPSPEPTTGGLETMPPGTPIPFASPEPTSQFETMPPATITPTPEPTATPFNIPPHLQTLRSQSIDSDSAPGFSFGLGYDSVKEQPLESGNCPFTSITPVSSVGSGSGQVSVYFVETKDNLYEALDISASVSINAGLFGASAKFHYANSIDIKKNCVNAIFRGKIFGKIYELSNPQFKSDIV